jgi:enoyl-CoA hydratase
MSDAAGRSEATGESASAGRSEATGESASVGRSDGGTTRSRGTTGESASVRVERGGVAGSVTTVIMDRPGARNAVNGPMAAELFAAFEEFDNDDSASVAVLWGENGTFCAGADLKAFGTADSNRLTEDGPGPMGPTRMILSKPVIAAVSGYAVAGGLELALWCDMRVVEEDAVFGVFCRRWGVPLIDGGTIRLPRLVGHSRAMDMILTGRDVDATEAHAIGLANRVVPSGQARERAEELAGQLAGLPQQCMRADRASLLAQWGMSESDALDFEFGSIKRVAAEATAGAQRFSAGAGRHGARA